MEYDEKAHGIIQDHISDALLIKTRFYKIAKALFDALIEIHWVASLPTAFYTFWQLFASTWDGTSPISNYIASLRTLETQLAGIKFSIDQRVLVFILLNSFTSSVINTVEEKKLTLDTIKVYILSEKSQLNPPSSESALKVSNKGRNHTVRCKTVAMSNPKPGHKVPCNQLWEFHFALVGTNKVQALGYNFVPRVMWFHLHTAKIHPFQNINTIATVLHLLLSRVY